MKRIFMSSEAVRVSREGINAESPPTLDDESLIFSSEYGAIDKIHAYGVLGPFELFSGMENVPQWPATQLEFLFPALPYEPFVHITIESLTPGYYMSQGYRGSWTSGTFLWGAPMCKVYNDRVIIYPAILYYEQTAYNFSVNSLSRDVSLRPNGSWIIMVMKR